jgi:hypothetical protein
MDLKQLLKHAHDILTQAQIDHALIGGIALGAYGVQRFTNDIDFLIAGELRLQTRAAFIQYGFSVYYESVEVLQLEGSGQIDILFANRPISRQLIADAKPIPGFGIKCVSAEGIIGLKIQAYKNNPKREFQDKADILALIEKNEQLDWSLLKTYADHFNEWGTIEEMRKRLGRGV